MKYYTEWMTKVYQMYSAGPDWPIFPKLAGNISQSSPSEYIHLDVHLDSQENMLICTKFICQINVTDVWYKDIFSSDLKVQVKICKVFSQLLDLHENLLDSDLSVTT